MGYDTVTKQYLKSLAGGAEAGSEGTSSSSGVDTNGFTMSGDINMCGNEIVGVTQALIVQRRPKSMWTTKSLK